MRSRVNRFSALANRVGTHAPDRIDGIGQILKEHAFIYVTLTAGTFLAWIPLFGRSLAVADDFPFMKAVENGGLPGYFHAVGLFRIFGQYLPIWLFLKDPYYHPVLVVLTHLLSTLLFFHLCRSLFGGTRLATLAALLFGMFPFGYEAFTWVLCYTYIAPMPFFLANLLLLTRQVEKKQPVRLVFFLSSLLAWLTAMDHEVLFLVTVACGLVVWIDAPIKSLKPANFFQGRGRLTWAPALGCTIWLAFFFISGSYQISPKRVGAIHLATIVSVYYRQYSLLDVFHPWFSPITRHLIFASWNNATFAWSIVCAVLFLVGLDRGCRTQRIAEQPETNGKRFGALLPILLMLGGASLVYVFGGGFSLDSRKKYPLVPILLLFGCWIYRSLVKSYHPRRRAFLVFCVAVSVVGAATTWLVVGIWKYETARYNSLADFIVSHGLRGPIEIVWLPDLYLAWPEMSRSLGYRFDESWVVNLAVNYKGGNSIIVSRSNESMLIQYDPRASTWVLGTRRLGLKSQSSEPSGIGDH